MRKRLFILFSIFVLGSMGCSLTSLPLLSTSTPTIIPTSTPEPTLTPLPSPTPTPTPIPEVRIDQGDRWMMLGDYDKALHEYQVAFLQATDDKTRAAALAGMGQAQYENGAFTEAIDALNNVIEIYPQDYHIPKAYYYLGQCYDAVGEFQKAAEAYQKFTEVKPGILDDMMQELRGDDMTNAGDYSDAIAAYQASINASASNEPTAAAIKLGQAYVQLGEHEDAIRTFMDIYDRSSNDYVKAQMDLLIGREYMDLDLADQAYARFQDAVNNYPKSYDSFSAMNGLLDAGQAVDELNSGLVYFFAGDYGMAVDALTRYINSHPEHDGTPHHYLALSYLSLGESKQASDEWKNIIDEHPDDRFWATAWDERAYTQWAYLDRYDQAAQTYLDFVAQVPAAEEASTYLYRAARVYEQDNNLETAAQTWERMVDEYPSDSQSYRGLFLAGVTWYRLEDYEKAKADFQRLVLLSSDLEMQSGAQVWIGKIARLQGDEAATQVAWQQAADMDPTGYYSERARELLDGSPALGGAAPYTLDIDFKKERQVAETWLRSTFEIPAEVDLLGLGPLAGDAHVQRGDALWDLGLYPQAGNEFEQVRQQVSSDPINSFRLLNHMLDLGFYRHAILISRQILDLAHMDDASTLLAPAFFNHVRFGLYFNDLILPEAEATGFDPLFLFSLVRQESFFEWYAGSGAGALGLMQLIPATADQMAAEVSWPPDFSAEDLHRPVVNITLGMRYLVRQRDYFGGNNLYVTLAAYNAGPGSANAWYQIAGDDPDMFLEVVRYQETRDYIMFIAEAMHIYERLYTPGDQLPSLDAQ
jgi:soluble lytic murein transglycosylase